MRNKAIRFTILGIFLILTLSGCFSYFFEVRHNPDGSGQLVIESILSKDYLDLIAGDLPMDESFDDILARSLITQDDLRDDPNIKSITEDQFSDPSTGALHHILEIEIIDVFQPIYLDQEDIDIPFFQIDDNKDGTFRFSTTLNVPSGYADEDMLENMPVDPGTLKFILQDSTLNWKLHVDEFIEGDRQAVYNRANQVVNWEIPIYDVLFSTEPIQIYAVYQLEPSPTPTPEPQNAVQPSPTADIPEIASQTPVILETDQPDRDFLGVSNWTPLILIAVLCVGLMFLILLAVLIILVVRNKNNQQTKK